MASIPIEPAAGVWLSEPSSVCPGTPRLLVDGVGDAVAGRRVPKPPLLGGASQEQVVVGVLVVLLDEVVIDVLGGEVGVDLLDAHRLELEHHHRAGGVLGEGLVDRERDLLARLHRSLDQVVLDELFGDGPRHRAG
jgi:hypothetical protein